MRTETSKPLKMEVLLNEKPVQFDLAACTIMAAEMKTYTGDALIVTGEILVDVVAWLSSSFPHSH